ncbi:rRNA methyltransferase 2, mitochondrial [Cimex lectularius]|uniref:rRNA methyltransferase 2, mitochondrial n=1 Tax=Cimex lectularius TaxID=79782 RepID=A0A8I6RER9_CIMLE|nr:rRNA methyltransferase 2, mitochondrial [Cimex lectularius]
MMAKSPIRYFSKGCSLCKQTPTNLKGKSKSSQDWLVRQLSDPYVEKAKVHNYRCRSAFKLLEINDKHKLLTPGLCVIDCGAAPGSWTQVAVQKTNSDGQDKSSPKGFVVGLDRLPIYPINGAVLLGACDFTSEKSQLALKEALKGKDADVVLSDMAPNATGVKTLDHTNIANLVYTFIRFALGVNASGGSLLVKLWEGEYCKKLENDISRFYSKVKWVKPPSSRTDSSEVFLLAKGFKGIVK